jgi:hypothetical protein
MNNRPTRPATSGFGLKATAQFTGDGPRFGVGLEGFIQFLGASLGVVIEREPHPDNPSNFLTHRGVEGTVFLTAGRLLSLYGRHAYVPESKQAVRMDAGLQLMLRWEDLETIADIIDFLTP